MIGMLTYATYQTLYMVVVSLFIASLFGFLLGVALIHSKGALYRLLNFITNVGRSFPFAILMVSLIPFTRFIVGSSIGMFAAIVPLSISAVPYIARLVENAFDSVDSGLIEAAELMGAKRLQIIWKVQVAESLPVLVEGITHAAIHLVGYSAMAGLIGGGGLGQVAFQYGYNRFDVTVMVYTVILLVFVVQLFQALGGMVVRRIRCKRGTLK